MNFNKTAWRNFEGRQKVSWLNIFSIFLCLMIFWVMGHLVSVSMILPHTGMRVRTLREQTGFAAYRYRRCTVGTKIPIRFWAKSYLKIWQIILTAYFITKLRVHTFPLMGSCARRDNVVHQRMNANGLLPLPLPFILLKQSKTRWRDIWIWCHGILLLFTYKMVIIHSNYVLCMMGPLCHTRLFFQSSWLLHESDAPSSAADQLLILLPAWRAGPPPFPPPRLTPFPSGPGTFPLLCGIQKCFHPI
jgi:hypothetical protein